MELKPEKAGGGPLVTGFSGQGFKVGGQRFPAGLLLSPDDAQDWDAPALADLTVDALSNLLERDLTPEFLLLGTGGTLVQPPRAFVRAMEGRGIGVEVMDSRAAARAWGVLRMEGRPIVAALMPL